MCGSAWVSVRYVMNSPISFLIRVVVSTLGWVRGRMINDLTLESCVGTFIGSSVLGTRINSDDKTERVVEEFAGEVLGSQQD